MAEIELVTLESVVGHGTTQPAKKEFRKDVATKLIASESRGRVKTWQLPKNSPYKLENGHLIKTGGAPIDKGAQELTGDPASKGQEDPA